MIQYKCWQISENLKDLPCNCKRYQYVDKDHGHIVTGEFQMISEKKSHKSFCKGANFRETKFTDFEETKTSVVEGIANCINTWYTEKGIYKMPVLECNQDVGKETSVIKQINSKIIYIFEHNWNTIKN